MDTINEENVFNSGQILDGSGALSPLNPPQLDTSKLRISAVSHILDQKITVNSFVCHSEYITDSARDLKIELAIPNGNSQPVIIIYAFEKEKVGPDKPLIDIEHIEIQSLAEGLQLITDLCVPVDSGKTVKNPMQSVFIKNKGFLEKYCPATDASWVKELKNARVRYATSPNKLTLFDESRQDTISFHPARFLAKGKEESLTCFMLKEKFNAGSTAGRATEFRYTNETLLSIQETAKKICDILNIR